MKLRLPGGPRFLAGVVCGVALVFVGREIINASTFPDRLIAPLLIQDSPAHADAIVVLGAGVIGDCVPNLNGMRRVVHGAHLFRDGRAPMFVITGGAAGGKCPVADAMAAFARELGVPDDRMLLERQSRSTHENGERTAPLLRARHVEQILLVTDRLHMRRAAGVFARLGFVVEPFSVPVYEGHIDNVSMLAAGTREAAALAYYRLRNWTADRRPGQVTAPTTPERGVDARTRPDAVVDRVSLEQAGRTRPVVILGASYAANWPLGAVGGSPVINAGIAGQQSSELLDRFERDVVARQPRAVVLWGFINDIFRADDLSQPLPRIRENYLAMIERARAAGIEPILATEVTVRPPKAFLETVMHTVGWLIGKQSYQDRINASVMAVNRWLQELARSERLLLLDLQGAVADASGQRQRAFATDDGSHISAAGYEALTRYAQPILSRHLGGGDNGSQASDD